MMQEQRHIYYDAVLNIEIYNLKGIVQKFPNHFHEYYVIGFVEDGKRHLWCKNKEYDLEAGDLIIFNPNDAHCCAPINDEILDYRAINIPVAIMNKYALLINETETPFFVNIVVSHSQAVTMIQEVYDAILNEKDILEKEEKLYMLLEFIIIEHIDLEREYNSVKKHEDILNVCHYMEENYSENISLTDLLSITSFGKSYLLRAFTKQVGVSPYRYLQSIRLNKAKQLLEQNIPILDVAIMVGFSDQSHLTNYFKEFIGVTPKQYQNIFKDKNLAK
ncbi:MAG: AraC family transcriptional regulator [Coprobacillaceae bacterium]